MSYVRAEMEKYGLIPLEGRLIRILKDKSCSQEEMAEYLNLDKAESPKTWHPWKKRGLYAAESMKMTGARNLYP